MDDKKNKSKSKNKSSQTDRQSVLLPHCDISYDLLISRAMWINTKEDHLHLHHQQATSKLASQTLDKVHRHHRHSLCARTTGANGKEKGGGGQHIFRRSQLTSQLQQLTNCLLANVDCDSDLQRRRRRLFPAE